MGIFNQIIQIIITLFKWWIVILPWEQGIRVRLGKNTKILDQGIHLAIPFIDKVFKQSIRTRITTAPMQTITSKDGKVITFNIAIGFAIKDILKLYQTVTNPEGTIVQMVCGEISSFVTRNNLKDCLPEQIEDFVLSKIDIEQYGLDSKYIRILSYSVVKTYRLIQDQHWTPGGIDLDSEVSQRSYGVPR